MDSVFYAYHSKNIQKLGAGKKGSFVVQFTEKMWVKPMIELHQSSFKFEMEWAPGSVYVGTLMTQS